MDIALFSIVQARGGNHKNVSKQLGTVNVECRMQAKSNGERAYHLLQCVLHYKQFLGAQFGARTCEKSSNLSNAGGIKQRILTL